MPAKPNEIQLTRVYDAPVKLVWEVWTDLRHVAKWWGPRGFTLTTKSKDFRPGGKWIYTMHGPDGTDYPNRSRFETIRAPATVVIRHVNAPLFRLHITLAEEAGGTRVHWRQVFDDARVREQLQAVCVPANEQNLDRLDAELSTHP